MCKRLSKRMGAFMVFVLVVLSSTLNAQDPSLVLYLPFDDDTPGEAKDHSQSANNGALEGNPELAEGKFGGALMFDATDDQVVVPTNATLDIEDEITMMAWAKPGPNLTADWRTIVGKSPTNVLGNNTFSYDIRTDNSGVLRFSLNIGGVWQYILGPTLVEDTWYHIAGTYDGQEMILYVDGEPVGTTQTSGKINVTLDPVCVGNLVNAAGGSQNEYWSGVIDEVRIWNRALSEEEVKRNMAQGKEELVGAMPLAFRPEPANGAMLEASWVSLSWRPGDIAVSHDVYLGDNFDDVNDGAEGTFVGNQTETKLIVGFPGFAYPDGLVPGTTYYWRIDEVNDTEPNSPWKGDVWSFWIPPKTAYEPNPPDGAKFVATEVKLGWTGGFGTKLHTVYFGDNFDDVNNAVVGLPQSATTYTPGTLDLDKAYYWRVDEFDGADTYKGDVWSFKTLPFIPITDPNLVGWWTLDEGMGSTALDWSGHGNHGTVFGSEWAVPGFLGDAALNFSRGGYVAIQNLSYNSTENTGVTVCAWIRTIGSGTQYIASFDRDNYWRLEINGSGGGPGQVGWDVMTSSGQLDYGSVTRVDDGLWHHVCGVFDNGQSTIYIDGSAEPSAAGGPTFGSGSIRYGFIGANSEATSFNGSRGGGSPISGDIDELRIYNKALTVEEITLAMRGDPLIAWGPNPTNGSTPYIRDATPLSWSPGDNASQHDVYFGTDKDAVADADESDTTGIYRGRQGVTIYTPAEGVEWGGGPYYWRVDEYNTDATISKGNVWSFTVADFIGIEDFEDYNDYPPDEIFSTWIDGWGVETNGSTAGYPDPNFDQGEHFVETDIVHGGSQSMPYFYENNFKYSEATMTLVSARDWTEEGVGVLSLWFYGDTSNAAERMYVALNGSATVYHDNPDAALIEEWTEWTIDLQEFAVQGVNLANVNTISIGFGDKNNLQAGGLGLVFFDDIRLYRPAEPEPEPVP